MNTIEVTLTLSKTDIECLGALLDGWAADIEKAKGEGWNPTNPQRADLNLLDYVHTKIAAAMNEAKESGQWNS